MPVFLFTFFFFFFYILDVNSSFVQLHVKILKLYLIIQTWKPLGKATLLNEGPGHHDADQDNNNSNNNADSASENPISKNRILEGSGIGSITSSAGISGGKKSSFSGSKEGDNEGKDRASSFNFGTARCVLLCIVVCVKDLQVSAFFSSCSS